ncbi:MAG: hypothetical protein AAFR61_17045 [Bacteroidota bacterium]
MKYLLLLNTSWTDQLFEFIITLILGILSGIIATIIYKRYSEKLNNLPLGKILNFGNDDLLFVFPHRNEVVINEPASKEEGKPIKPPKIIPRTATEDFIAINNIISAILKLNWRKNVKAYDVDRFFGDFHNVRGKNLVTVCSRKINKLTNILAQGLEEKGVNFFRTELVDPKTNPDQKYEEWRVVDNHGRYPSRTYTEMMAYLKNGKKPEDFAELKLTDKAVITKMMNPWNAQNKIIMIAGARGIGTWGAAECIKKEWKQIQKKLRYASREKGLKSNCDFSALIEITYEKYDIKKIEVQKIEVISVESQGGLGEILDELVNM